MNQLGVVIRINKDAGFGYVRDGQTEHTYIFVVERSLSHRTMQQLRVGSSVWFKLDEQNRVVNLVLAQVQRLS